MGIGENVGEGVGENTGTNGFISAVGVSPEDEFDYPIPTAAFSIGSGTQYYVSKTGNDTDGLSEANAFATIKQGMAIVTAGDTINVGAGTWQEVTTVDMLNGTFASTAFESSGTASEQITLRALPGDEGSVIIDGQGIYGGVFTAQNDYCQVYGLRIQNCMWCGIGSWSQAQHNDWPSASLSIGTRIENNYIGQVYDLVSGGENPCGINIWATKDAIVRNNKIRITGVPFGVHSYGQINSLIENNDIVTDNSAIFWKDYFVDSLVDNPRGVTIGAEVRYNRLESNNRGVYIGIRAGSSPGSGYQYVHHNIIYGFTNSESYGVVEELAGALDQSTRLRVAHNTIDMGGVTNGTGVKASAMNDVEISGNIITDAVFGLLTTIYSKDVFLTECDYNVYEIVGGQTVWLDQYAGTSSQYSTLANWQSTLIADATISLLVDNPDTNGAESTQAILFNNAAGRDYTNKTGSPAIGMMSDGSNAGAYQSGSEIIGLLPTYSAGA